MRFRQSISAVCVLNVLLCSGISLTDVLAEEEPAPVPTEVSEEEIPAEQPAEEPAAEQPAEEPVAEQPDEEPVAEQPAEEPAVVREALLNSAETICKAAGLTMPEITLPETDLGYATRGDLAMVLAALDQMEKE